MKLIKEITKWMGAVLTAWYGWVGGSATAGLIGFGQGMGFWVAGRRVYIALLVAGFLISMFSAWAKEHRAKEALTNPVIPFEAGWTSVPQEIQGGVGIHRRISIKNCSTTAVARNCELYLESCSKKIPGLTADTALLVKDLNEPVTDISPGATKHFDLFMVALVGDTDRPLRAHVLARNWPVVPRDPKAEHSMMLRLTGNNFNARAWRATVSLGGGDADVIKLEQVD